MTSGVKRANEIPVPIIVFPQSTKCICEPEKDFFETPNPHPPRQQVEKQVFMSHEIEVKSYRDVPTRRVRNFKVTRVISPYEFYMEFDMDRPSGAHKSFLNAMQLFYNDPKQKGPFKIRSGVLKFRCYVHFDLETKRWERVRAFKVDAERKIAEVWFCDQGFFRLVDFESLMEIHKEFSEWTAQVFCSHLADIQPTGGGFFWPKAAVDYFKGLVEGKVFKVIVVSGSEVPMPEGFPDTITHIAVVMVQRQPLGQVTVNSALVAAGFAQSTGILSGYPKMFEIPCKDPSFYPFSLEGMRRAEYSQLIPTWTKSNLSKEQNEGIIQMAMRKVEEVNFAAAQKAIKEEGKLEKKFQFELSLESESVKAIREDQMPRVFRERLGAIKFLRMNTPHRGYIIMQHQLVEVKGMEAAIAALVNHQPHIPFTENRSGFTVAVLVQMDMNEEPFWYRAMVKQCLPQVKLVKIVLIDHALELSVKYIYTRYLPPFFEKIPSYVHRVHMSMEGMRPAGDSSWNTEASETFRRYLWTWEREAPYYYTYPSMSSKPVLLEDVNQDIEYDVIERKWVACYAGKREFQSGKEINHMKYEPLLAPLYLSIGINVMFEVLTHNANQYRFESLSEVLTKSGFAHVVDKCPIAQDYHDGIVAKVKEVKHRRIQLNINNGVETVPSIGAKKLTAPQRSDDEDSG